MKNLIKSWLEDNYHMWLVSLPFAVVIATLVLALIMAIGWALTFILGLDSNNAEGGNITMYRVVFGLIGLGFVEGIASLLGCFVLALKAPKYK